MRRSPAPFWFVVLAAVASAAILRELAPAPALAPGAGVSDAPPAVAFLAFLIPVATLIWNGIQVAGKIALAVLQYAVAALQWSVKALWAFAQLAHNGVVTVGKLLAKGFREAWDFLRFTYDEVLKPAWQKFWQFVDWAKRQLEELFGPVIRFLQRVRAELLDFYNKWVRPVLDVIGVARKVLRVFASLGLDWARALDRKLGELEQKIDAPFRWAIGKINELINVVNRIVTADGLFQRLALIRSIERDLRFVSRAVVNWRSRALTEEDFQRLRGRASERTMQQVIDDAHEALMTGGGRHRAVIAEATAIGMQNLKR